MKSIEKEFKVKQEPKTKIGKPQSSMNFGTPKTNKFSRFWNWLWHSDSILSWIVALIFAFIIVKFIFFPILSLIFQTSLPLVVVESSSMHHPGSFLGNAFSTTNSFNSWWQSSSEWYLEKNITAEQASSWPFRTGMEKGDIIVVSGWGNPEIGDVIIFNANQQHPIIHRIIKIEQISNQAVYSTKGDNNPGQLEIEKQIPENAVIGKSVFKIPKLGWLKLIFVEILNAFSQIL